jgi:hypothetical protein
MSSSIEKIQRSIALTNTERSRRHREKQHTNQQPDHASNAETQQPRPIPLTSTERSRRHRASKRQNQSNDAEAQNRSVALTAAERKRREREAKRKNRVDFAYSCNTRLKKIVQDHSTEQIKLI